MKQTRNEVTACGRTRAGAARPTFEPGAVVGRRTSVCTSDRPGEGRVCHSWTFSRERPPSYDSWPPWVGLQNRPLPNSATFASEVRARTKTRHAANEGGPPVLAGRKRARLARLARGGNLRR